ncbi:MAG: DUF4190 domain-containing protein [Lachnospiraceae bacterium]|nr:DUF4190 domain-containing protein [Lachnospiraceae bacterium]
MGIAGLVLGILSLVLCWVPVLDIIFAIAGIILSAIGIARNSKKGCGIGGLITSIIGFVLGVIITLIILVATGPQLLKWTSNSQKSANIQSYDTLIAGAQTALCTEGAFSELKNGEIIITLTRSGVEIRQNGEPMSSQSMFIQAMSQSLGSDFMESIKLKGNPSETPVITITKAGKVVKTVEPEEIDNR